MDFRVLGPVAVEETGSKISLGGPRQRSLLAVLLLNRGRTVTTDALVDAIWGEEPPSTALGSVQVAVSRLRRVIGADRVVTTPGGYLLMLADGEADLLRFRASAREATRSAAQGDLARAVAGWERGMAEWRGSALGGVADTPGLRAAASSLEEERLTVLERCLTAQVDLGRPAEALSALEQCALEQPYREAFHGLLMRALYLVGRQADALAVARRLRSSLADDLGIDLSADLEALERDILNHAPGLAATPTMAAEAAVSCQNQSVPRPATPILGRERVLRDLEVLLSRNDAPIVTITGPGGVGKTRIATEVARRAPVSHEVLYVGLEVVKTPEMVIATIAAAMRLRTSADEDLVDQMASALRQRELLLILDNFEHVIGAAPAIGRLVSATSGLQVLVTSRESLKIKGEYVCRIAPLPLRTGEGEPAVELFYQRAAAADPDFEVGMEHDTVLEICSRLDGLPLAIELAAAWTSVLPLARINDRLAHRLTLLTTGNRDSPERQQSLRACLEWSVGLLAEQDQRLLGAASVFVGGASLSSMETVLDLTFPELDVVAGLDSLVAKSLMSRRIEASGHRFVMLETIREFASEVLAISGDEARVRAAHARHVVDQLSAQGRASSLPSLPPRNVAEFELWTAEAGNARAALDFLIEVDDTSRCAELVRAMCRFWQQRGAHREVYTHSKRLMRRTELPLLRRVEMTAFAGQAAVMLGDLDEGESLLQEALSLLLEMAPHSFEHETIVRVDLSTVDMLRGDVGRWTDQAQRAVEASRQSGDPEVIAIAYTMHPLAPAPEDLVEIDEILSAARLRDNQVLEGYSLLNLSEKVMLSNDESVTERAWPFAQAGFEVASRIGDISLQAGCLCNSGAASLLILRQPAQAVAELRQSLELARRGALPHVQIEALLRMAAAEADLGNLGRARRLRTDWTRLARRYDVGLTPTNLRILNDFLSDLPLEEDGPHLADRLQDLAETVDRALKSSPPREDRISRKSRPA